MADVTNTEKFIELVRERNLLFDFNHVDYKNRDKKAEVWLQVATAMGFGESKTWMSKWKSLRDNYNKFKKNNEYAYRKYKNWPWASQMRFLDGYNVRKETGNDSQTFESQNVYPSDSQPDTDKLFSVDESQNMDYTEEVPKDTGPQIRRKRMKSFDTNYKILEYLTQKKQNKSTTDEVDDLFLNYAETFKTFPPEIQSVIKLEIAAVFSRYELQVDGGIDASAFRVAPQASNQSQVNKIFKNEEKTKQFFQLVKERDQLWNVDSPLFNDEDIPVWISLLTTIDPEVKQKKPDAIEKLAVRLKNEWQRIQDQYNDAMIKEIPYKYEEHLEFVKEIVKNRVAAPVEIQIKVEPKEQIQIEIEKDESDVEQAETDALASCSGPPTKKVKIEYDEDSDLDEEEGVGDEEGNGDGDEEEEGEDEDLAFFASITGRVKSLPEEGKLEFRKEVMKVLRRIKKKYEIANKQTEKQYRQVGKTVNIE